MRKNLAQLGVFLAASIILSYIENLLPLSLGVPGIKLGLANLVVVLCLYLYHSRYAILISAIRVIIVGFMFGNLYALLYSLAGAGVSFLIMVLIKKKTGFKVMGISILGGVSHNMAQLAVAAAVVSNVRILYLFPYLLIAGAVTGALIGIISATLIPYLKKLTKNQ